MSRMKIYEYAKKIDKQAKELVSILANNGVEVKSHMSIIDDKGIEIVNKHFGIKPEDVQPVKEKESQVTNPRLAARGARSTSARSVGTAAVVKKEVEKEKKAEAKKAAKEAAKETKATDNTQHSANVTKDTQAKETQDKTVKEENIKAKTVKETKENTVAKETAMDKKAEETNKTREKEIDNNVQVNSAKAIKKEEPDKEEAKAEETKSTEPKKEQPKAEESKTVNHIMPTVVPTAKIVTNYQAPVRPQTNNNGERRNSDKKRDNRNGQGANRDNRNGQGGYNRDNRNGQGGNRDNRNGQGGNRDNRNGQGTNRDNRNGQGGYNRDNRNGQGGYRDNRNGQGTNRDNRNGQGTNRDNRNNGSRDSFRGDSISTVFNPANSGKNADGRNNRSNWANKKNDKNDKKYDDSRENLKGLTKNNNKPKKGQFIKPEPVKVEEPEDGIRTITLPEVLTVKELADKMKIRSADLIKKLFLQGKVVTINQEITFEDAEEIALEYNCIAEKEEKVDVIEELLKEEEEDPKTLVKRPPVVCVMGHVDHGKTSLLDAIRKTNVTAREAGGITQHIGAYVVNINGEKITFLDTPGHEAFTSMRMRGANSTDIAILVVAADDGVMPQTVEAINHAKAAGIQIIVAINKIDKPSANIERVKQELVEYELVAEDWGGDTVFVPVSAHTGEGIENLLEMIILTAEMCELKANPDRKARGLVIEAQLDKGRGPVATVLVQKGTLHVGDSIVIGSTYGKVRAMIDDKGRKVKEAKPSTPVEILGLNDVPNSGEILMATENEKEAKKIAETFIAQGREKLLEDTKSKLSLDGLFSQIQAGNIKELNIIVKADVQGSVEAVKQSLLKLSNDEVAIRIIHGGVGAINESDVILASASNAIIIGFNVRPDNQAKDVADREKVDLRLYKVIYNAIEDVEAAMKGMLDPVYEEKVIGHAEVRQIFKASGVGNIAGSYVLDGKIQRNCLVRITREGELIYTGELASLKRFKDDVKEVATGYECGLVFSDFDKMQELDQVECYIMVEVPR